jgi:hypothetical protein
MGSLQATWGNWVYGWSAPMPDVEAEPPGVPPFRATSGGPLSVVSRASVPPSWPCVPNSVTRRLRPRHSLTNSGWSQEGCMGDRYCRGILPGFESASGSSLALRANGLYLPGRTCSLAEIAESPSTEIRLRASCRQARPRRVQNLKVLDPVNRYHNDVRVSHQPPSRSARPVLQTLTPGPVIAKGNTRKIIVRYRWISR